VGLQDTKGMSMVTNNMLFCLPSCCAGNSSGGGGPIAGLVNSVGSSRLSSASGPGNRGASGPGTQPLARGLSTGMPGSPLKQH
jgi:hypothetical protein